MSSYQFVNSLASCYPQSQINQQQGHQSNNAGSTTNANSGTGAGGGGAAGTTQTSGNSEYFPAAAYTPNLYPNTPQAHYANQAYNLGAQQNTSDMVDYTQLQPQRLLLQNQQQSQAQQQQQTPQPQSCKYAAETTPTGNNNQSIASPQDLSTRDISPKLSPNSVVESVARSLNKTTATAVSSTNASSNHSTSGLNSSSSHTTNVPMHSPAGGESDTSSESGNEAGSSQNSSGKKTNGPPQIYPWMKRVHLGQSKYFLNILFSHHTKLQKCIQDYILTISVYMCLKINKYMEKLNSWS